MKNFFNQRNNILSKLCIFAMTSAMSILSTGCSTEAAQVFDTSPEIIDTSVEPSNIALSTFQSDVQFVVTTKILHFDGTVNSVKASVENQSISYDLTKLDDITGGEEWGITSTLTLWEGISEGIYYINITAVSSAGQTVTQTHAAAVNITSE